VPRRKTGGTRKLRDSNAHQEKCRSKSRAEKKIRYACDDIELTSDKVSHLAIVFEFLVELAA
jgi:hypothetical protein